MLTEATKKIFFFIFIASHIWFSAKGCFSPSLLLTHVLVYVSFYLLWVKFWQALNISNFHQSHWICLVLNKELIWSSLTLPSSSAWGCILPSAQQLSEPMIHCFNKALQLCWCWQETCLLPCLIQTLSTIFFYSSLYVFHTYGTMGLTGALIGRYNHLKVSKSINWGRFHKSHDC